jgi:alanine-glyoxylate transaminase/serine-glyoxylate transaminase/serine-pyruvate transaminase
MDPKWYSPTVTAIRLPEHVDGKKLVHHAHHQYNLALGGGLDRLAGRAFRIGHLGQVNDLMAQTALAGAEMCLRDFGVEVVPGSGVGAAQEYLRTSGMAATAVAAE